jgi:hypothetical protein
LNILYPIFFVTKGKQDSPSYTERLAHVAVKYNLPDGAVKEKGQIMRDLGAEVPVDPRTILKRSRSRPDSEEFHHFGLVNGLSQKLTRGISSKVSTIQIMINIDGIPLWKSSPIS